MRKINVMEHELVPEHHLISEEEEKKLLQDLGTEKESLPKIKRNDPAIKMLERIYGPIRPGRVIKIIRKSPTSGKYIAYRVVTEE
ncbi:MAG: DNA-directed RNA polymerase subunit H [Thermoplasmata archaeon]|jgi:DNA-directed RNA polymerase subunit H|nr:DNA-directed RNA polymerase subunit H [Thermoplasmata archaeon]MVT13722.1 DNA-directed RNA polymerase subunit H [Euryarchaeota archaeon]MVT15259.1 DNA-directed RNA polymerase subunit H [Euryarchaeota archaeon]MVT36252.1 DNA-directed RNA polymerase subunit H [Euryarchaeota archaeon]